MKQAVKRLVLIVSGKGGVGKTTFARLLVDTYHTRKIQASLFDADGQVGGLARKALKMSPKDRKCVWATLGDLGLSPDDPEVVRLLVTEYTKTTLNALSADLEQATTKALRAFETAQSQTEASAQARLAARQAELAQTLAQTIRLYSTEEMPAN